MPDKKSSEIPFLRIWQSYPADLPCVDKTGQPPPGWGNQCAVKLGVALANAGVSFSAYPRGGRCPTGPADGPMIGSAQNLANWLHSHPFSGCASRQMIRNADWQRAVMGRTGIVFFKDYWRRPGETRGTGSGDHIDLWNLRTLTPSWESFLRFYVGISRVPNLDPRTRAEDNLNWYSDLGKASEIWFWPVR
jgi:hypothetical protein